MDSGLFTYDPLVTGTKGVIFVGKKLLIYRRDTNTELFPLYLDLPGGGSEAQETPFETFQRELKEEFDLDISPDQVTYARRYPSWHKGKFVYALAAHFPASVTSKITLGDEGTEWMLMDTAEFLRRDDVMPITKVRVHDYLLSVAQ